MPDPAPVIRVDGLHKTFQVAEREAGLSAAVRSLFHRHTRAVHAVAGVSFEVAAGEVVGFLGPNGAGKTTTRCCPDCCTPPAGRSPCSATSRPGGSGTTCAG